MCGSSAGTCPCTCSLSTSSIEDSSSGVIDDTGNGCCSRALDFLVVDAGSVDGLVTLDFVPKESVDCVRREGAALAALRRVGGIFVDELSTQ